MANKRDSALRRMFSRRIEKVIDLNCAACGFDEGVQEAVKEQMEFREWFVAILKQEREAWYDRGVHDGCKNGPRNL
jgi:hypothetical protein